MPMHRYLSCEVCTGFGIGGNSDSQARRSDRTTSSHSIDDDVSGALSKRGADGFLLLTRLLYKVCITVGVSKMNEGPYERLQRAKNEAEGFRAQCSEHPARGLGAARVAHAFIVSLAERHPRDITRDPEQPPCR